MTETLEGFESKEKVGGRKISNFRFADDIELSDLIERVDETARNSGMEISG